MAFLAFDPLKSPCYNIILLCLLDVISGYGIDVYSLKTESWTQAPIPFERPFAMFNCDGVYFVIVPFIGTV